MLLALASFSRLVGQAVSQEGTCMQPHTRHSTITAQVLLSFELCLLVVGNEKLTFCGLVLFHWGD